MYILRVHLDHQNSVEIVLSGLDYDNSVTIILFKIM